MRQILSAERWRPWRRHARLLAVAVFLAALFGAFRFSGLTGHFELAALRQVVGEHQLSGMLIYIAFFALGNLLQIPGWLFLAAAVFALGAVWGGVMTYIAANVSCVATFLLIRLLGGSALRDIEHPWAKRLFRQLDVAPTRSVFGLRLLFQTVPALNYALAMSGIPFRAYLVGTLLGLPLPIAAYCMFFELIAAAFNLH